MDQLSEPELISDEEYAAALENEAEWHLRLASLRTLRLDPDCGCHTPKPRKRPENGHNPALTNSAPAPGLTPTPQPGVPRIWWSSRKEDQHLKLDFCTLFASWVGMTVADGAVG